jgi:hypothetical protein
MASIKSRFYILKRLHYYNSLYWSRTLLINAHTSSADLAPAIGPRSITAIAPQALAKLAASAGESPANQRTKNPASNESPAPVGSISTGNILRAYLGKNSAAICAIGHDDDPPRFSCQP